MSSISPISRDPNSGTADALTEMPRDLMKFVASDPNVRLFPFLRKLAKNKRAVDILTFIPIFFGLSACGPLDSERVQAVEEARIHCLDHKCPGDVEPTRNESTEVALKLNGRWFIGPSSYFSTGINGAAFYWPSKTPSRPGDMDYPEKELVTSGRGDEVTVIVNLRSTKIPPEPHGYSLVLLAEKNGWIESRRSVRLGLDQIRMKHVIGPNGHYIDHVTYYAAVGIRGADGLPPVATCSHDDPRNSGGTGFLWRPGIWAGTTMNQSQCADWPEIYQETIKVLSLLKEI